MSIRHLPLLSILPVLLIVGAARAQVFTDVTSEAGVSYPFIPENEYSYGPGAAFGDWDNDGDPDLYATRDNQGDLLFENDGSGNFTNVSSTYIVDPNLGDGTGCAWGDLDRDGDLDLYVCNAQINNVFYRNLLVETGVPELVNDTGVMNLDEREARSSMGVALVDFNLDGWLDIYVCNYVQAQNYLYQYAPLRGFFVEQGEVYGVDNRGYGFVSLWTDLEPDGDPDVYVINDFSGDFARNTLYRNNKKETGYPSFTDITDSAGEDMANDKGMGMGVASGDFDKDGLLDIYVTNYYGNNLYRNNGDGTYQDVAIDVGVGDDRIGWGTAFADYDNDRDMDILVVNGYISGKAKPPGPRPDICFRNNGHGAFSDYSSQINFDDDLQARALALADIDMDGDLDAYVTHANARYTPVMPILYRNDGGNSKTWLGVRLYGVYSNPQGIGARIEVRSGPLTMIREVNGGSGFLSQHSYWQIFGIGTYSNKADTVRVYWPSGMVDQMVNVPARQYISVVEGSGIVAVTLQSYHLDYEDGGVTVSWEVRHDGEIEGYSLDRRGDGDETFETLAGPDLLRAGTSDRKEFEDREVRPGGEYEYRLRAHRSDGRVEVLAARSIRVPAGSMVLAQNEPNPFNPSTTIRYELGEPAVVDLAVYDLAGRRVRTLVSGFRESGVHAAAWDGRGEGGRPTASGVYFYRLRAGKETLVRKMVLAE
jgi:hypothetical protein